MLNSISWLDFCIAVGLITTAYYLITFLLLFSQEIKQLLKGRSEEKLEDNERRDTSTDVLGTTRSTVNTRLREDQPSQPFKTTPNDPQSRETEHSDEELLTGAVSDLLDEIKTKIHSLKDWNKDECLPAFAELLEKYPQLKSTVYQESINHFIANICSEHFQWSVEPEEISPLWPG
jgi:hypothetical protein